MKCGDMRHRIRILRRKPPTPPIVSLKPEFDTIATVWAKKEDKINEEQWSASAINAVRKKQLVIRYRNDIDESMFVELGRDTLGVLAVAELGNNKQWLILLVGEVVNVGG